MSGFDPAGALRRYHDAINRFDFTEIEGFFAEEARYVSAGIGALSGRDAIMAAFRRYFEDYADQVATDDRIEAIDHCSVRAHWRLRATSSRTGEVSLRRGEEVVTFDERGRIVLVEVTDFR